MTGERALNIAGSIASLAALGYLLLHLPRKGETAVAGLGALKLKRLAPGYYQFKTSVGETWSVEGSAENPAYGSGTIWRVMNPDGVSIGDVFYRKQDAVEVLESMLRHRGSLKGLPTKGRVPLKTAQRALKKLPRKAQACRGMTPAALREGMEIEREHRDITKGRVGQTAKIAAAHICERSDYYSRIKRYVEG